MTTSSARPTLRDRKRQLTRDIILDALTEVVREKGLDFAVQDVAERAGLSHRTVYRFFESREALIEAARDLFEEWLVEQGMTAPESVDDLPGTAETLFALLDRRPDLSAAGTIYDLLKHRDQPPARQDRTRRIFEMFDRAFPHVPADERERCATIVRFLHSGNSWYILSSQAGLNGSQSGPFVRWATETLLDELRAREAELSSQDSQTGKQ